MRYQPQGLQRVSRVWRDRLSFLWSAASPDVDLVGDKPYTIFSSADLIPGTGVGGKSFTGGSNRGRRFTPKSTGSVFTVFAIVTDRFKGTTRNPFDSDDQGSVGRVFQLRFESSNVANFIPFDTGGSPYFSSTSNTAPSEGLSMIAGVMAAGGVASSYLNGQVGPTTNVGTPRFIDGTRTICVGNFNDPSTANLSSFQGDIYLCGLIKGTVTKAELDSLYANPWQLFEAPEEFDELIAAVGGYTITADKGTFVLTNNPANTLFGRRISADTRSYALTGNSSNLLFGRRVIAESTSYSVNSFSVGLYRGYKTVCDSASFALTGNATQLYRGYRAICSTASYSLTGQSVNIRYDRVLSGTQQSFSTTGYDTNLLFGRKLSASTSAFTLSGIAANLVYNQVGAYSMQADLGQFILTGNSLQITAQRRMPATVANYSLSGNTSQLVFGRRISGQVASYNMSGTVANFFRHYKIVSQTSSYVVTGRAVVLTYTPESFPYTLDPERTTYVARVDRYVKVAYVNRTVKVT